MSQTTQRRISEKVKSTRDSDLLPFHEILDAAMVNAALDAEGVKFKDRIYTPVCDPLPVPLSGARPDHSCRAAVVRLISGWR